MNKLLRKLALFLTSTSVIITVVNSRPVKATVIVDQGTIDPTGAYNSDLNKPSQQANSFFLSEDTEITEITWSGRHAGVYTVPTDSFTLRIFSFENGTLLPESEPLVNINIDSLIRTDSGIDFVFGEDIFNYSAVFQPFTLPANDYFLSIFNNSQGTRSWYWVLTPTGDGVRAHRGVDGEPWIPYDYERRVYNNLAFTIRGESIKPVPEPTAILGILAIGTLGAASTLKRNL